MMLAIAPCVARAVLRAVKLGDVVEQSPIDFLLLVSVLGGDQKLAYPARLLDLMADNALAFGDQLTGRVRKALGGAHADPPHHGGLTAGQADHSTPASSIHLQALRAEELNVRS